MAVCNPGELPALLPLRARVLGLDVGSKTIGLALSDFRLQIASPLGTIRRVKFRDDMAALAALMTERSVGGLLVGLPLRLDGKDGPRTQSVRQFAKNVVAARDVPLTFWDERMSTLAVERDMVAADLTRQRRAAIVDRVAAAYILQGYLDWLNRQPSQTAR
jgi:putative holliday junction resolvase